MVDGIMIQYAYLKLKIEIINSILNEGNMLMIIKKYYQDSSQYFKYYEY